MRDLEDLGALGASVRECTRLPSLGTNELAVAVALFEQSLTPRNTVLFASTEPGRLPPLRAE